MGNHRYFHITAGKFVLMSLCTFGIYEIYWNYKNWQYIKQRDESSIWPFWRAISFPLWFYSLLSDVNKHVDDRTLESGAYRVMLTTLLIALNVTWRLPDPYWLVMLLTIIPAPPAIRVIDRANASAKPDAHKAISHRPVNFIAYVLGGPLLLYIVALTTNYLPNTTVISGAQLWDRDVAFLRDYGLLSPEEEIIYFYSAGVLSIREDGQFISPKFVTTYVTNPEDGEIYMAYAEYEDIENIEVHWGETWWDDTIITITPLVDEPFEIWLSQEAGGDRKFVSELDRLWRANGGAGVDTLAGLE